jgi:hypothetical protein
MYHRIAIARRIFLERVGIYRIGGYESGFKFLVDRQKGSKLPPPAANVVATGSWRHKKYDWPPTRQGCSFGIKPANLISFL